MIVPAPGVAFTSASEGDVLDAASVAAISAELDIRSTWAVATQVHGAAVLYATDGGDLGPGDAIITEELGLPVSVRTADCVGVVARSSGRVGVAHAGWRGLAAGILEAFVEAMDDEAADYFVGPAIGPCCYEVGGDVAQCFREDLDTTTWGTRSVDLVSAARRRLPNVVWSDDRCTHCDDGLWSHRRDGTHRRLAAIGWL